MAADPYYLVREEIQESVRSLKACPPRSPLTRDATRAGEQAAVRARALGAAAGGKRQPGDGGARPGAPGAPSSACAWRATDAPVLALRVGVPLSGWRVRQRPVAGVQHSGSRACVPL